MNHKVCIYIHLSAKHSQKQLNKHHRTVKRTYVQGQSVLAKDYRHDKERWIQGRILRHSRNVTYMM